MAAERMLNALGRFGMGAASLGAAQAEQFVYRLAGDIITAPGAVKADGLEAGVGRAVRHTGGDIARQGTFAGPRSATGKLPVWNWPVIISRREATRR